LFERVVALVREPGDGLAVQIGIPPQPLLLSVPLQTQPVGETIDLLLELAGLLKEAGLLSARRRSARSSGSQLHRNAIF
jgi:hypothetical protein